MIPPRCLTSLSLGISPSDCEKTRDILSNMTSLTHLELTLVRPLRGGQGTTFGMRPIHLPNLHTLLYNYEDFPGANMSTMIMAINAPSLQTLLLAGAALFDTICLEFQFPLVRKLHLRHEEMLEPQLRQLALVFPVVEELICEMSYDLDISFLMRVFRDINPISWPHLQILAMPGDLHEFLAVGLRDLLLRRKDIVGKLRLSPGAARMSLAWADWLRKQVDFEPYVNNWLSPFLQG